MQHKDQRITETPNIQEFVNKVSDMVLKVVIGCNDMAYNNSPMYRPMVKALVEAIEYKIMYDQGLTMDEPPRVTESNDIVDSDSHLESGYSVDNYMDDGEALASAGFGTDEDYGPFGGEEF